MCGKNYYAKEEVFAQLETTFKEALGDSIRMGQDVNLIFPPFLGTP